MSNVKEPRLSSEVKIEPLGSFKQESDWLKLGF